jgi:DNA-directed RNA polymerase subunit RPC12/RpoP
MDNDSGSYFGIGSPGGLLALVIAIFFVLAAVALALAPSDRKWTFFWLTIFVGPLGILLAVVASPRDPAYFAPRPRPIEPGRKRFACPRCGAHNDIPEADTSYNCWRCSERRAVKPKSVQA